MQYLRLRRGRVALVCFVAVALLFAIFPAIDLTISKLFFRDGFYLRSKGWPSLLQASILQFLVLSMSSVLSIYLFNRWTGRNVGAIDGRKVVYLLVVLVLGAGVIVNSAFKDHWGRARPRDVAEFGGARQYTPAFKPSQECLRNCSFPSGDAAAAFFSLALARALGRSRALLAVGVAYGVVISLSRVAVGAHFFSDVVVSFFLMWIIADVLYYYMVWTEAARAPAHAVPAQARANV